MQPLYVRLIKAEGKHKYAVPVGADVVLDLAEDGTVLGIEVLQYYKIEIGGVECNLQKDSHFPTPTDTIG
jgi:uncharacterized protein YuzE